MTDYNAVYRASKEYRKPYVESAYYPLWQQAVNLLPANRKTRILELGCGPGQFAAMLHDLGYTAYTGIDSSAEGVKLAQASGQYVVKADAFKWLTAHDNYDVIVALETLEHLDDRRLLGLVKPGTPIVLSVPNFPNADHKRHFATGNKVKQHYSDLLDFTRIGVPLRHGEQHWFLASAKRKRPRIVAIMPAYNELDYMPVILAWCKRNHLTPFVLDNYSTDGTWAYLKRHGVKARRVDTHDTFDLRLLQEPMPGIVRELGAEWAIYTSIDLFTETDFSLDHAIAIADSQGYNLLEMQTIGLFNTGESRVKFDPFNTYFYFGMKRDCYISMIAKIDARFVAFHNDGVIMTERKPKRLPGIIANMGMTKPAAQREEVKERRLRAASQGSVRLDGAKYRECSAAGWTWKPGGWLKDIRQSPYWKYYQRLQSLKW